MARFPYRDLLWEMTRSEVLLRDQGTLLGFVWTLLQPALMFAVLYALFAKWLGKFVDQYVAYLLIGIVLWNFFQKSTTYALTSFRRHRGTLLNYAFPREIVPLSAVASVLWSSLMEVAVLLAALPLLLRQPPQWTWLLLPVVLALELLLAAGLGLLLAVAAAEYQDVERTWEVLTSALFYLTPVFYPVDILRPSYQRLMRLNPLAGVLSAFRACAIDGRAPGWLLLAGLAGCGGLCLAAGLALVRRRQGRLLDALLA